MSHFWRAGQYAKYLKRAKTRHGVHSPFVYKLIDEVIYNRSHRDDYDSIDNLRKQLLKSPDEIEITDLGAGSTVNNSKTRKVADVAKNSAKGGKWGRLLYKLSSYFQPETMLELGTSFGTSTLYQCKGNPAGKMITLEGCPKTAAIAAKQFEQAGINPTIIKGDFDETLSPTLAKLEKLDWAFIDGNHRKEPTIRYFEQCVEKCHSDSVLLFDDIYWSKGMAEAWLNIKAHPRVTVSIDLFQVGIVFLRTEQVKEHFTIRY